MKKKVLLAIILLVSLSVGLVYAQEDGYFLDITDSNANIDTSISNSTVFENVTLSNGTLTLDINADNISTKYQRNKLYCPVLSVADRKA